MLPCEIGGEFKIGVLKFDVLSLLLPKFSGTAPIAKLVAEPRRGQTEGQVG